MQRNSTIVALAAAAALIAGCANAPAPVLIERDPVDGLIAKNAANATQALRELSEAAGSSRVVTTTRGAASPAVPAPVGQVGARAYQQQPVQAAARVYAEPLPVTPPANSIASRRGSIAVEIDTPTQPNVTMIAGSSGVVASGGLLSAPPTGLERLITVRWTGELEQLLARIAQESGWKLGESTGFRVAPVIVSISAENRSAFDVLRDIGAIAGTSADILVSAPTKTISIRYPQR